MSEMRLKFRLVYHPQIDGENNAFSKIIKKNYNAQLIKHWGKETYYLHKKSLYGIIQLLD